MADPYPIRPITADEFAAYRAVDEHAFHGGPPPERDLPLIRALFEADRSLAAFDPALPASAGPVGIAGAHTFRMSVPGGAVPAAGVTYVRWHVLGPRPLVPGDLLTDNGRVAAMKITLSAAMRARDVSRPTPEQLAGAAEREQPTAAEPTVPAPGSPAEEQGQPRARRRRRRAR